MYLTRVEAHGFKSFADRQRFDFGPGMTAVVGPNGSGKSNVSDAIRWALGEQSTRSIRARKTEDVIFSGSDQRRPVGVAEVTLTLDNAEGWMAVDFAEVTVTRRAYRSGENEYLINGQRVRLMDVHDLFRRANVGQNSYAMMSQGLVDEVLAMRAGERRGLIEEAAGVAAHRQDLTRAERRLTETRDNLGRVRMLIRELTPRLRQLERQSVRAARYRELDQELTAALQLHFGRELRTAQEALTATRGEHDQRAQAFHAAQAQVRSAEQRMQGVASAVTEQRTALEAAQVEERRLSEEALRVEQAVALAEQRLELLAERRSELQSEIAATAVSEGGDAPGDDPAPATGPDDSAAGEPGEQGAAIARPAGVLRCRRCGVDSSDVDLPADAVAFLRGAARVQPGRVGELALSTRGERQLAIAHRSLIAMHLDRDLRSARVLRELGVGLSDPPTPTKSERVS